MTTENKVIEYASVLIGDNRIISVNQAIPDSAEIIDGKGKWLIPGLTDMHVHGFADINFGESYPTKAATFFVNDQDIMTLYVANGVTTVFDLNASGTGFDAERDTYRVGKGHIFPWAHEAARILRDDWGVLAHTTDAQVYQRVTPWFYVRGSYRFHHQNGVSFYTERARPDESPRTSDSSRRCHQR